MNYINALEYIHSTLKFGMKPGLERVKRLLELLGNPQKNLKFIHIAGTNGKGSVSTTLSSIYTNGGYKVGLFISPFVTDWCERIQVNCKNIPHEALGELVEQIKPCVEQINSEGEAVTEFEIVTAVAFLWYAKNNCDVVILEVGLGGRFDATNVIDTPLACAIMKIDLDHTAILGDTLDKIANEKCGIIKKGTTVVSYPLQEKLAKDTIENCVSEKNAKLINIKLDTLSIKEVSIFGSEFSYNKNDYKLKLVGKHQVYNAIVAIEIVNSLQNVLPVETETIKKGMITVTHPARLEVIAKEPLVILDGAHNPSGSLSLRSMLDTIKVSGKKICIMGMLADKDFENAVKNVTPYFDKVYTLTPNNPRALDSENLATCVKKYCSEAVAFNDIATLMKFVKKEINKDDLLACWGSLYLAGDLRPHLLENFK